MYLSTPKRDEIYRHLLTQILEGQLDADGVVPTELSLANEFDATRSDVQMVMKELQQHSLVFRRRGQGTRVNDAVNLEQVRKLLGRLSRTIAVILPDGPLDDPHWNRSTAQAIEATLRKEGYGVMYQSLTDEPAETEMTACLDRLKREPVGGVILLPNSRSQNGWLKHERVFSSTGVPVGVLDRGSKSEDTWSFNKVRHEPEDEGRVLAEYLDEKLSHPLLVVGDKTMLDLLWVRRRISAIRQVAADLNIQRLEIVEAGSPKKAMPLLAKMTHPVVIGLTDAVASKFIRVAEKKGRICGRDFELIGFDNDARYWTSNLTTVAHQHEVDGESLARLMVDTLRGRYRTGITTVRAQPIVIERSSCRA